MTLRIAQHASPRPDSSWWDWAVWLEGPPNELDRVREVTYQLHPSFPEPVRRTTSRPDQFRLEEHGSGEFEIVAHVTLTDGSIEMLHHWLSLSSSSDAHKTKPPGSRLSVFVSSSASDADLVAALSAKLRKYEIDVVDKNHVPVGASLAQFLEQELKRADAMVVIASSDRPSPWVEREVSAFQNMGRRSSILPVFVGIQPDQIPNALRQLQGITVKSSTNLEELSTGVAGSIADRLRQRSE
jgi:TIR domain/YEATS family